MKALKVYQYYYYYYILGVKACRSSLKSSNLNLFIRYSEYEWTHEFSCDRNE